MRNPISHYIKHVEGWEKLPYKMFSDVDQKRFPPNNEEFFCSYLNPELAIQISCDVHETHIHVSFGPVPGIKPGTPESEIVKEILKNAESMIGDFFGDMKFIRMPDHPLKPSVKHFFHNFGHHSFN